VTRFRDGLCGGFPARLGLSRVAHRLISRSLARGAVRPAPGKWVTLASDHSQPEGSAISKGPGTPVRPDHFPDSRPVSSWIRFPPRRAFHASRSVKAEIIIR
jgi:hypothetical protein